MIKYQVFSKITKKPKSKAFDTEQEAKDRAVEMSIREESKARLKPDGTWEFTAEDIHATLEVRPIYRNPNRSVT